ncbi:MAG: radical SAM protein [Bacteroidales bacterium]|nr:radical SAM protein [Bacteroidales bacterium]
MKDNATRAAIRTGMHFAINHVKKNPETGIQDLVKVLQKYMPSTKEDAKYTRRGKNAVDNFSRFIDDSDSKWIKYGVRVINEVDEDILTTLAANLAYEAGYRGLAQARKLRDEYHTNFPWVLLMDPTSACNLRCTGCWAAEYGHKLNLSYELMDSIIEQGKKLGIYFYLYTGGEPLVRKDDIIKLCKKHSECEFMAFTNGTLVDEKFCKDMLAVKNLTLAISVEGFAEENDSRRGAGTFEKVMHAMDLLKQHKLLFGTSICYTSKNIETVTSDKFLQMLVDKGVLYSWYFHYMPVGNDASLELLPSVEQRKAIYHRIRSIRTKENPLEIMPMDFQNDGEYVGGCIAGGKNYLHINANGDVEPCVFIHYSTANIKDMSLFDALKQPLFNDYHDHQAFNKNMLRPCPMLENPGFLKKMVAETGAKSTDLQSPETADHLCEKCAEYAKQWAPIADELWKESGHADGAAK